MITFLRTHFFTLMCSNTKMHKKLFANLAFMLIFIGGVKAQNVSYNLNSIPITGTNSTALGFQALSSTGTSSTAIGYQSQGNFTGSSRGNTSIGAFSLQNSTVSPAHNTAVGEYSLNSLSGDYNTAVGSNALSTLSGLIGSNNNTAIGANTVIFNSVPPFIISNSTAIGSNATVNMSNTIQLGDANVTQIFGGVGTASKFISGGLQITGGTPSLGYVLTSDNLGNGTWQPAGGGSSGTSWDINGNTGTIDGTNFIGTTDNVPLNFRVNNQKAGRIDNILNNAFYGFEAGNSNSIGVYNTGIGDGSLSLSDGSKNTALGYHTLFNNKNGDENVSIGSESLLNNATGSQNTSIGVQSLFSNTQGGNNVALGYQSLYSNNLGNNNVAVGDKSLFSNTNGLGNTAIGFSSLGSNTNGYSSTAIGASALFSNTTGYDNVAIGVASLFANTTSPENVAIGYNALSTLTTGYQNCGLGFSAQTGSTSRNSTALGAYANTASTSINSTAVGSQAIANANNKVRLGDASVTVVEGPVSYTVSDGRFKTNIKEEDVRGLDFINKLRPVVYNFDTRKFQEFLTQNMPDSIRKRYFDKKDFAPSTAIRQSGFIAQEVEKAAKETGYDFNGVHVPENKNDNYSLAYAEFVVPLVKSVQELSRQNDSLKKEIAEIKAMIIANAAGKSSTGLVTITTSEAAKLFQNAPNPFSKATTIRYTLPDDAKKAMISITSVSGVKLKEFDLKSKGGQSIEINGGQLAAGTYIYSLYVDNNLVDSKQMILTK